MFLGFGAGLSFKPHQIVNIDYYAKLQTETSNCQVINDFSRKRVSSSRSKESEVRVNGDLGKSLLEQLHVTESENGRCPVNQICVVEVTVSQTGVINLKEIPPYLTTFSLP